MQQEWYAGAPTCRPITPALREDSDSLQIGGPTCAASDAGNANCGRGPVIDREPVPRRRLHITIGLAKSLAQGTAALRAISRIDAARVTMCMMDKGHIVAVTTRGLR